MIRCEECGKPVRVRAHGPRAYKHLHAIKGHTLCGKCWRRQEDSLRPKPVKEKDMSTITKLEEAIRKDGVDGLQFERLADGSIRIYASQPETIIERNIWTSIVLNMTSFGERPNDFDRFLEHHDGRRDVLSLAHPWNQKPS